jgi:hypothetical protein
MKQLHESFGSSVDIANTESFGLPKNIDFNSTISDDIKNIKLDEIFRETAGNHEKLTGAINSLDRTLARPRENLIRFSGKGRLEFVLPPKPEIGPSGDAIDYFEAPGNPEPETEAVLNIDNPQDMQEPITDVGTAKVLLRSAEHLNALDAGGVNLDLRNVEIISNEALTVWQDKPGFYNFHGLKNIDKEAYGILSRYKGRIILNDQAFKQFEDFDKISSAEASA